MILDPTSSHVCYGRAKLGEPRMSLASRDRPGGQTTGAEWPKLSIVRMAKRERPFDVAKEPKDVARIRTMRPQYRVRCFKCSHELERALERALALAFLHHDAVTCGAGGKGSND